MTQKILIADDDQVVHESLGIYLRAEGFETVDVYDGEAVSLAVVSDAGITLLNLRVTPDKTLVYYAMSGLPKRVQAAFGHLARAAFFTACPKEEITYYDASLRGTFEVRTQGAICP